MSGIYKDCALFFLLSLFLKQAQDKDNFRFCMLFLSDSLQKNIANLGRQTPIYKLNVRDKEEDPGVGNSQDRADCSMSRQADGETITDVRNKIWQKIQSPFPLGSSLSSPSLSAITFPTRPFSLLLFLTFFAEGEETNSHNTRGFKRMEVNAKVKIFP